MRSKIIKLTALVAACLMLQACSSFRPKPRTRGPVELPARYALYTGGEEGPNDWWQAFDSPELNRLIEAALTGNFNLKSAWARLKQARATAKKTGANLYPTLGVEGTIGWQQIRTEQNSGGGAYNNETQTWNLGAAAGYEVDLWGKLKAEREAETLTVRATREDLEAAAVTLAANVAATWIDILAARHDIAILNEQIEANRRLLELQEIRYANGQASALDVSQQREILAASEAELPLKKLAVQTDLNSLALLLGRATAQGLEVKEDHLPKLIPLPDSGLPADLLAARPDVRAAGLRVRSADWDVSAARADRLPRINLSAGAALNAAAGNLFFNNWVLSLLANLTAPVFDGGSRRAEVERTRAVVEEKLNDYAQTVAEAVKEVEDSLVGETRRQEYINLLREQLAAARITQTNALVQYQNGQSEYSNYLSAWTSVQTLERSLISQRAELIKNRVDLYRALGGDWAARLDRFEVDNQTEPQKASSAI